MKKILFYFSVLCISGEILYAFEDTQYQNNSNYFDENQYSVEQPGYYNQDTNRAYIEYPYYESMTFGGYFNVNQYPSQQTNNSYEYNNENSENYATYGEMGPCEYDSPKCYPCLETPLYLEVEGGYKRFRFPGFTYGFTSVGVITGPLDFLTFKNDQVNGPYVDLLLGVLFCGNFWLGSDPSIELSGTYFAGDKSRFFIGPFSNGTFAANFPFFTPGSGPFELTPAPTIGRSNLTRNYVYQGFDLNFNTNYTWGFSRQYFNFQPFIDLAYKQLKQHYGIHLFDGAGGAPTFLIDETLKTEYYDFGAGLCLEYFPADSFSLFIKGGGYGSYAHTGLNAYQFTNVGTAVPEVRLKSHKDVLSSKFIGSTGLSIYAKHVKISLIGNYEYWGYTPQMLNPQLIPIGGGDFATGTPPGIRNSHSYNYSVGLRLSVPFSSIK